MRIYFGVSGGKLYNVSEWRDNYLMSPLSQGVWYSNIKDPVCITYFIDTNLINLTKLPERSPSHGPLNYYITEAIKVYRDGLISMICE